MIKMREMWPSTFNQTMADSLRAMRPTVIDSQGMVDLEAARRLREANKMAGPINVNIIEGEEVNRLQRMWSVWLRYAK